MKRHLEQLKEISNLKDNWNGNGAKAIPSIVILRAINLFRLIEMKDRLIEVFPLPYEGVQVEYDNVYGNRIEIEVLKNNLILHCEKEIIDVDDTIIL